MNAPRRSIVAVDATRCSGCRRCEIVCSYSHEGRVWPEASRVRVFALLPGAEVPHLCMQCDDYPCVAACPVGALSVSRETGAVLVDGGKCTACGACVEACPGRVPHVHPAERRVVICDLCGGDPLCVKVCSEGGWGALYLVPREDRAKHRAFPRTPEDLTREAVAELYGGAGVEPP